MKLGIKISILILLIFRLNLNSQNNNCAKKIFELNPALINGKIYSFSPPKDMKGSPYLFTNNKENIFFNGNITIQDICYKNLSINYDIYNQKLLLKFPFIDFGEKIIEISEAWLQYFHINGKKFILEKDDNNFNKIYQIIGEKNLKFYYYWYNRIEMRSNLDGYTYYFSSPQKKMYLKKAELILQFKNNRTLIKLFDFDNEQSKKIKTYLKKNQLKVKKASDDEMLKLINFCNTL
ncbi:MAG: hypothetical protein DRJ01_07445 [Bacteroidetes bacterium]|nr:MAG: hypothetical protein DRJ01_07445 [Bacteroidota bacterium]